jgi:phosphoribosylformylglycinamidine cyclo-ligase
MVERSAIQDVNVDLGDDASRFLYEASRLTHLNRPDLLLEFHESFSGSRAIPATHFTDPENMFLGMNLDGVGTKVEIAERTGNHTTVAYDLFAMVCDDAVVRGAEPVAVGSILDVRQLANPKDPEFREYAREVLKQLAIGYVGAAAAAGVVVINGEVAELGDRVGGYDGLPHNFNYNWGATVLWFAHRQRLLTGREIKPGDSLVGLAEHGFRSNAITAVRKAMLDEHGPSWHSKVIGSLGKSTLGQLVQAPSTIYSKFVTSLTGGYDPQRQPLAVVSGVAHITGGGQPSKLGRMLEPSGLGAIVDDPIKPPAIMTYMQDLRLFSDEKAYTTWHMGPGMVIATPEPEQVLEQANLRGVEAQRIGQVTSRPGIRIKNMGAGQEQSWLDF